MSCKLIRILRSVSLLTAAVMLTVSMPAARVNAQAVIYGEYFDATLTNSIPSGVTATGEKARVIEAGNNNKMLKIPSGVSSAVVFPAASQEYKNIISINVAAESKINASIYLKNGTSEIELLKIIDNVVKTTEEKVICGITANFYQENDVCRGEATRLDIAANRKTGTFSVYINGVQRLSDWKMSSSTAFEAIKITKSADSENSLFLDDIMVYEGSEPTDNILKESEYNEDGEEYFTFKDDLGDYTFFHSSWPGYNKFATNIKMYPKTNEAITSERFDYKNPEKGDKLIFTKSTADDSYIDINMTIGKGYSSTKEYKNFKISGEFMCDFEGEATAKLFMLRDSTSSSAAVNEYPVSINSDRSVSLKGASTMNGAAANENCFKITMYLELDGDTPTVTTFFGTGYNWQYNNYKMVAKKSPLINAIKNLNLVRIACGVGAFTGRLLCRNVEVTGFEKPFVFEDTTVREVNTSMFDFYENIEQDLAGKTCFSYRGNSAFANGEKYKLSDMAVYKDNEYYISTDEFNRAYNEQLTVADGKVTVGGQTFSLTNEIMTLPDGKTLIPLKEVCQTVLGYNVFDDDEGLIVTSPNKIYFDKSKETPYHKRQITYRYIDRMSPMQSLYDYMLFDRPSKEELLQGYNSATANSAMHPSIMATKSDFDNVKRQMQTDAYYKGLVDNIIKQADNALLQTIISFVYDDSTRTLNTARRLENRMQLVGFAYQITGEQKYADYAWQCLNALNDFPDLNPCHLIDSGSYGVGIAIGYDWCYDGFTEQQRQNIRENAMRLYLSVFPASFYGRIPAKSVTSNDLTILMPGISNKWFSNFNTWTNSGGVCMALAFMHDFPDICSDFLEETLISLEYTMKNLYPDGAWAESSNYWYQVTRSLTYVYGALDKIYGTDFNLSRFPGTDKTVLTNMALRGLVGNYNYHDASQESTYTIYPMSFFGKYFNERSVLAARKATLSRAFDDRMTSQLDINVVDALYYDPTVEVDEIKTLPRVYTAEGMELFTVHEDYTDYDGLFMASQGGPVTFYHSHNDVGDFVFDLNGIRWATALGPEDYNSSLPDNEKYRKRNEGHNTIVINNSTEYNQLVGTYASLEKSESGEGGAYAVYDLSQCYADADEFKRGFYVGDNFRSLTVRDEIKLNKDNSEIYWFMHTTAEASILNDNTLVLSQNGESVILSFSTNADDVKLSIMNAVPLPNSPAGEGQTDNAGYRKVAIKLTASGEVNLTVRIDEFGNSISDVPVDQWTPPEKSESAVVDGDYGYDGYAYGLKFENMGYVPVVSTKSLPRFTIQPHDPEKTAELEVSDSLDKPNILTVYNKDKTRKKMFILPYDTSRGIKDLVYDEVTIASYSVTAEPQPENSSANMFDNDFASRWTTLNKGESATFDLGSIQRIDGIAAAFWQSPVRSYYFDLLTSNDGVNWTPVGTFDSSSGPEEYQVFAFQATDARFIKLIGNGSSANVNTNVLELRVLKKNATFEHISDDVNATVLEISIP